MGNGCWEVGSPQVLVAILTRELVATKWAFGFRELQLPPNSTYTALIGLPFHHARNSACQQALSQGYTWLFFLDDDVIPPPDAVLKLMSRGRDIISGLYYRRSEPILPVMMRDTRPKTSFITDFKPGEIVDADLVGAGCLLIHRRVLERIPPPKFEWLVDHDGIHQSISLPEEERCSEDFAFCRKARRHGFSICVDTSVSCDHAGLARSHYSGGPAYTPLNS